MTTLQEDATAMLETIDASEDGKKYERLSAGDRALIFQLHAKDVQQTDIARIVGCHASTVCRALKFIDTRQGARMILNSKAADMAQHVADKGDAENHRKVLTQLEVLPPEKGNVQVDVRAVLGVQVAPEVLARLGPSQDEIDAIPPARAVDGVVVPDDAA